MTNRDEILELFRIPPDLVGTKQSPTKANAMAAYAEFVGSEIADAAYNDDGSRKATKKRDGYNNG